MSSVNLYKNKAPREKINKTNDLTLIETMTGNFRNTVDVLHPIIQIELTQTSTASVILSQCNYIYIADFDRYYYVNKANAIVNNIIELECDVDVLMSWKTQILAQSVIVSRNEKQWNAYLDDGRLKVYNNPNIQTYEFSSGFTDQSFILAVAGSQS